MIFGRNPVFEIARTFSVLRTQELSNYSFVKNYIKAIYKTHKRLKMTRALVLMVVVVVVVGFGDCRDIKYSDCTGITFFFMIDRFILYFLLYFSRGESTHI